MNPLSNPTYLLPPLVTLVASSVLLVVVWRGTRRSYSTIIFYSLLFSVALWSFLLFGMRSSHDVHQALPWDRAISVSVYITYLLYYHFTLTYTNNKGQRGFLLAAYLLAVVISALAPTDLLIERMRLDNYGYAPVAGPIALPLSASGLFLLGGGIYNLFKRYKASHSYEERNRILYLTIAALFPLTGALLDGFSNLPPATVWGYLIFCILCSVAIAKYHLLDIRVVVRKSLVYLLVSALVAIPYLAILLSMNQILKTKLEPWWAHAIIILLLAIILRPLYSRVQKIVDRLFYRERYDSLKALQQFSHHTKSILNVKELSSHLVQLVNGVLQTSSILLLLVSEDKDGLVVASSIGLENPLSGTVLKNNSPLIKWLEHHGDILSSERLNIIPQLQNLSLREKNALELMGVHLFIPIKSHQGQLCGVLVLGEKRSQQSYSREDRQLLIAVSNQMAIALDNARLYEEIMESEKALRESEERLRLMFESVAEGITVSDLDGNIVQLNDATVRMHGYQNKDELIGRSALEFIAEKDHTRAMENMKRTLEDGYVKHIEYTFLRSDGSEFLAELSASILRDVSGSAIGFVATTRDITDRKQAEEREKRLQQELNHSSRLAAIGELAAGIAHEMNNPLTGVIGFAQLLMQRDIPDDIRGELKIIADSAQRVADILKGLLSFAHQRRPERRHVDINEIMRTALALRAYELESSNIKITCELTPELPRIMADDGQLQEVALNIVINAETEMKLAHGGGNLFIKTEMIGNNIRISFKDDGPGITKEDMERIFNPFFTTREVGQGTGLGLSVCHGIVSEHNGRIYVESELGKGATFFVELPIVTEAKQLEMAEPATDKFKRSRKDTGDK